MAEQVQEIEETTVKDGVPVQTTRRVRTDNGLDDRPVTDERTAANNLTTVERIVYYIAGVLITLLAFRFVLSLLGANRGNAFAAFIYNLSYPFVAPFFGLFGYTMEYGRARFEIETLVAIAVYAILAYGIVRLMEISRR